MFNKTVLDNKLRILTSPVDGTQSVTMMILVKVGSRNENDKVLGGAHYIEHLMFKGTKKRPNTLIISKELDAIGAEFNAFTGKEYTVYYVKSNAKHFDRVCDILYDMVNHSVFDADEMEREKKVIVEEIKMYYENPLMHLEDVFEEVMYQGNSLALNIAGTKQSVLEMNRDDVLAFRDSAYTANNMVVALTGAVNDNILGTAKKYFEQTPNTDEHSVSFEQDNGTQTEPRVLLEHRDTEQAQLMLGFKTPGIGHDDLPALKLLSIIMGGNMSSRLFISIREQKGLCYSVSAGLDSYQDVGSFRVRAGLDKNRLDEAVQAIGEELKKVVADGVTDEELQRAKDFLDGKLTLKFEDTFEWARWYGMQELMEENLKTPQEKLAEYMAVTKDDITRVAQQYINMNTVNLAIIGPFTDEEHFKKLLLA